MEKIRIEDIKPGMWVKVRRDINPKSTKAVDTGRLTLSIGVITHIPTHQRFCVVQFYSKAGKALYKECFHWTDILLVMPNYRKEERYASV